MSVVDPGNPNLFSASDFVTQIVDEVNALKQRIIDRVATLQAEDADIRVDYVAADAALNAAIGTALGLRLISPVANLSLPALVPNAALVTGPGGTTLTWDSAYGEFVTNAAALTQAVEDATKAAEDATTAAEAAQAAVDTGAVSKSATADQVMNGNLIVRKDGGALIAQRADDASKLVQLRAAPGSQAKLEYGSGYSSLSIPGTVAMETLGAQAIQAISLVLPNAAVQDVRTGAKLSIAAGGTLELVSLPINPTDAANKQYVDGPRATALVLPSNAVNPLEAVPLQQVPYVGAALRRVALQITGSEVSWDGVTTNVGGIWLAGSPTFLNLPNKNGVITANVAVRNDGTTGVSGTVVLAVNGVFRATGRYTAEAGSKAYVSLSFAGNLSGTCFVSISPSLPLGQLKILGEDGSDFGTNIGVVIFP